MKQIALLAVIGLIATSASAAVIFQQDFSSSTVLGDYINATAPNTNTTQFGAMEVGSGAGTFAITNETLTLDRTLVSYATNRLIRGNLNATTLFSMTFDLKIESANFAQDGTQFLLGEASTADYNLGSYAGRFVFVTITGVGGDGFTLTPSGGAASAKYTIGNNDQWAVFCNNTDSVMNYTDPNGVSASVAARSYDLWIGGTVYLDDQARYTTNDNLKLTGFNMAMGKNDDALWTYDNFLVRDDLDIIPTPEPATMGLLACGAVALIRKRRK